MFITLEGIEGAGKSTQAERLAAWCRASLGDEKNVVLTREPGGTGIGERVRAILLDPGNHQLAPMAELLLVFAARAQHLSEVIRPALARGDIVVCDRFTDATFAYQGGGRGLADTVIAALESVVQGELRPDFTVVLDVDWETARTRLASRGAPSDRFEREQREFFERVRARYLDRAAALPGRYAVLDASGAPDEVAAAIVDAVRGCLEGTKARQT